MSYLHNAWYPAGWSSDLSEQARALTILDQPIMLFRGQDGRPAALYDACPHRFAPLSLGKIRGDRVTCGYHGLEFDGTGRCVRNPHGNGAVLAALNVRSYALIERHGMVWIWMGEKDSADHEKVPHLPVLDDPELTWVYGEMALSANYQLVIDNLLDLSHVEYLHPFLSSDENSGRIRFRAEQEGDRVSAFYDIERAGLAGVFKLLARGDTRPRTQYSYMHWAPPASLFLDIGLPLADSEEPEPLLLPGIHLLSPETEDTTHYFWAIGRNRCQDDEQVSEMIETGVRDAFENEDEPMIRAVRTRMKSNDLFAHRPALLPIDEAAVRARRLLAAKIEAEQRAEVAQDGQG